MSPQQQSTTPANLGVGSAPNVPMAEQSLRQLFAAYQKTRTAIEVPPGERFTIQAEDDRVEVASTRRVPFEARGWTVALKEEATLAIKCMKPRDGYLIFGEYSAPQSELVDAENAVFYNFGTTFRHLTRSGLRFERAYRDESRVPRHVLRYEWVAPGSPWRNWTDGDLSIAYWPHVTGLSVRVPPRLSQVWWAFRRAEGSVSSAHYSGPFAVRLTLHTDSAALADGGALVKPMIDGLLCALHSADSVEQEVVRRIAAQVGEPETDVSNHLLERSPAPLGNRRLVWRWRDPGSVQWNPQDDDCVAGEVRIVVSAANRYPHWEAQVVPVRGPLIAIT
jgi:hypothetical protein